MYMLMVEAMSPTEDLGVRLAASDALKRAIDDFQFNPDEFVIFLEPTFSLLFALLKEVNECDTKVRKSSTDERITKDNGKLTSEHQLAPLHIIVCY